MRKRVEVELLGDAINAPVIQLPERRFPGILIQGDSLARLTSAARRCKQAAAAGTIADTVRELEELVQDLSQFQREYEKALTSNGIDLPYVKS